MLVGHKLFTHALLDKTAEVVEVLAKDGLDTFTIMKKDGSIERKVSRLYPYLTSLPTTIRTKTEFYKVFPKIKEFFGSYGDEILGAIFLEDDNSLCTDHTYVLGQPSTNIGYLVAWKKNWTKATSFNPATNTEPFEIIFNDHDDGYVKKSFKTETERDEEWDLMLSNAPLTFTLLMEMGYITD